MGSYIVKKGDEYFVENFKSSPGNCVLTRAPYGHSSFYKLVNNSIDIKWGCSGSLVISFKNQIIDSCKTKKIQQVCDYFNKYNQYADEELQKLYILSQNKTKSDLQLEIESLQQEKKEMEEEIDIYRQIKQKRQELDELLDRLNTTKEIID